MSESVTAMWGQRLIDATHLVEAQRFLDIGGGDGSLCRAIERLSHSVGTVVDPAVSDGDPPNHVRGTAEALPFPDSAFDVAILSHAIHLSKHPVVSLREAARVVRPGGHIALRFTSYQDMEELPAARWDPDGFAALASRAPTVRRVTAWAKRAGLGEPSLELFMTPFAGTYEQWMTGLKHIVEQGWLRSGCPGSESPTSAFEAFVRREYREPVPFHETLLVFTRP